MSSAEQFALRRGLNIRDALIFLVDFRISMTRKDSAIDIAEDVCQTPGVSSLLSITLRCIADVLKAKIIARNSDAVAVVAFGCRGSQTRKGWPGVRVLRPMKAADAAGIKLLQRIAQRLEGGEADDLVTLSNDELRDLPVSVNDRDFCFGPDEPVEFDKALWAVRHHFTAMTASRLNVLHRKRVFVFTNDDDPAGGNRAVKQLSLTQTKDLADMGATLDISILMSPSQMDTAMSEGPDSSTFFNDLVYTEEEEGEDRGSVMIATICSFEDLLTRVRRKEATKRAIRKTVLVLAGDYKIGVALYSLVKKATRPTKVELAASTNRPVFKITTATCERIGEILKPEGIRYMFTPDYLKNASVTPAPNSDDLNDAPAPAPPLLYGFKKSEVFKAKALGPMGIVMYGYRKKSVLKREYTLGAPTFVFPEDTLYVGSTKAFACLLKCMIQKDVVGIASVRLRENSGTGMRFAALVPQEEILNDDVADSLPGGFQLYYLPYKDDVYTSWRNEMKKEESKVKVKEEDEEEEMVVKQEEMEASELNREPESVSVARKMVKKMTIPKYSPRLFLNPDLQRFYAGLENAAGVESRYNPQDDLLNPDIGMLQKKGGVFAEDVKRLEVGPDFDGDALAQQFGTKSAKRAAESSKKVAKRKAQQRVAREEAESNCDDSVFVSRFQQGTLDKLLKAELQLFCRAHGLNDKGTKKNLMVLVEDHIAEKLAR